MGSSTDYVATDGKSNYRDTIKTERHYATMDDICSELRDKFMDFVDMSNAAYNMSMSVRQMGQEEFAMGLSEMGYELFTHAYFIKHELKNYGVVVGEEEYRAYKALEERVKRFQG